jgi:hypothetical protein
MLGGNVCRVHGCNAPQTKAKAKRRLEQAADALDRAGLNAKTEVEIGVKPYETIIEQMESGSRAAYRQGITDVPLPALPASESDPDGIAEIEADGLALAEHLNADEIADVGEVHCARNDRKPERLSRQAGDAAGRVNVGRIDALRLIEHG